MVGLRRGIVASVIGALALVAAPLTALIVTATPAGATDVTTQAQFLAAFSDSSETTIRLLNDITLTCPNFGSRIATTTPVTIDGQGQFTLHQSCANALVLSAIGDVNLVGLHVTGGELALAVIGNVTMTDSTISDVTSTTTGALAAATIGNVTLTRSVISNVTSSTGAAGISNIGATTLDRSTITGVSAPGNAFALSTIGDTALTDSAITHVTGGPLSFGISTIANSTGQAFSIVRSTVADVTGSTLVIPVTMIANDTKITNSTVTDNGGPISDIGPVEIVYSDIVDNGATITTAAAPATEPQLPKGVPDGLKLAKLALPDVRTAATTVTGQLDVIGDLGLFGTVLTMPQGGPNCKVASGSITSHGYNFSDDTSCGLTGTGDRQGAGNDPGLGALGDNGGPTPTRLPQTGSPLIDAIPTAACQSDGAAGITTDQRSLPRPAMAGCDIGAVEVQPPPPIVVTPKFTG